MRNWLFKIGKGEDGQALTAVLALLVLGSLITVPSINYVSTSLKIGEKVEKNMVGLYAADAGVEDALWKIGDNVPSSFPFSYQLTGINGMTVDIVIDEVTTIAGEAMGESGIHEDYLGIIKLVTYDAGIYDYSMSISNNGTGNVKIEKILIKLQKNERVNTL